MARLPTPPVPDRRPVPPTAMVTREGQVDQVPVGTTVDRQPPAVGKTKPTKVGRLLYGQPQSRGWTRELSPTGERGVDHLSCRGQTVQAGQRVRTVAAR